MTVAQHQPLVGVPFKLAAKYEAANFAAARAPIEPLEDLSNAASLLEDTYIFSTERIYVN